MSAVNKVLVIGGGFSGMSAAIQLRKNGVEVDLVELDSNWRSYGAGITISGPTLRALRLIGVLDEVMAQGSVIDGCDFFTADGTSIGTLNTPRVAGPDVPGSGGIMRPILAAILAKATRESGTHVRLGRTFVSIEQDADGVDVLFDDGDRARYDLVVGADGLASKTRQLFFPHAPALSFTGQGVWRAVVPRPPGVVRPGMYLGPRTKTGFTPVSAQEMYIFITEDRPTNDFVPADQLLPQFLALLSQFTAPVLVAIRQSLGPNPRVVYRPLEALLLPLPWSNGRIILIGDAVHATTPHLASGAGIGIEDAIVLAEELKAAPTLQQAFDRFSTRRFERCRIVVENSVRLGEIERTGGSKAEHGELMRRSVMALAEEI